MNEDLKIDLKMKENFKKFALDQFKVVDQTIRQMDREYGISEDFRPLLIFILQCSSCFHSIITIIAVTTEQLDNLAQNNKPLKERIEQMEKSCKCKSNVDEIGYLVLVEGTSKELNPVTEQITNITDIILMFVKTASGYEDLFAKTVIRKKGRFIGLGRSNISDLHGFIRNGYFNLYPFK